MTIILTFDASEEREEMLEAIHGASYCAVLTELDEWLRRLAKYEGRTSVSIEEVRKRLREETEGLPIAW